SYVLFLFLLTAPPTPELYTLSLHDALPIAPRRLPFRRGFLAAQSLRIGLRLRRAHGPVDEVRGRAVPELRIVLLRRLSGDLPRPRQRLRRGGRPDLERHDFGRHAAWARAREFDPELV